MKNILLSIIIVSWNVRSVLNSCLTSLDTFHLPLSWEVIVFDNASQDGTDEMVRSRFPNVRLIRSDRNIGFAGGNNRAAEKARGEYLLLLNPDTLPTQRSVHSLLDYMRAHTGTGVASPQLLLPDGMPQPYAFGKDPTPYYLLKRALVRAISHRFLHEWQSAEHMKVDWVSGAAMIIRREAWDRVGGFDENFFMYFEDNDLCLRVRQEGWDVVYLHTPSIVHFGGMSARQNPLVRQAYQKSLRYFYRKHYGVAAQVFLSIALPLYSLSLPFPRGGSLSLF